MHAPTLTLSTKVCNCMDRYNKLLYYNIYIILNSNTNANTNTNTNTNITI